MNSVFASSFYDAYSQFHPLFQDEQIKEVHDMIEMEEDGIDAKFKQIFEYIQHGKNYHTSIFLSVHTIIIIVNRLNTILAYC